MQMHASLYSRKNASTPIKGAASRNSCLNSTLAVDRVHAVKCDDLAAHVAASTGSFSSCFSRRLSCQLPLSVRKQTPGLKLCHAMFATPFHGDCLLLPLLQCQHHAWGPDPSGTIASFASLPGCERFQAVSRPAGAWTAEEESDIV